MHSFDVYRTRIANYSGQEFLDRFGEICADLHTQLGVLTFAFILYDESTPELRKLLRDSDYYAALDRASGDRLVVFTLSDESTSADTARSQREALSRFPGTSSDTSESYSVALKAIFDEDVVVTFPSVLFFQIIAADVFDYRLVPLKRQNVHQSLMAVQELFRAISQVLDRVEPQFYSNQREIFFLLDSELRNRDFTALVLKGPRRLLELVGIIRKLAGFLG